MENFFEQLIFFIPYILLLFLIVRALFRKEQWIYSTVLAMSFSSGILFFLIFKDDLLSTGYFKVGLTIGIYSSLVATIPLLVFGWYLGTKVRGRFILVLVLIGIGANFLVVKSYHYVIKRNAKILSKPIEFDCTKIPYHCAIRDNKLDQIVVLKSRGFDIEARDRISRSSLWYAIDNREAVKVLLENGANPDSFNIYGETPLAYSLVISTKPNLAVAELLMKHGANINRLFSFRKKISILNFAIVNNDIKAINFALDNGADPYILDGYRKTPCDRLKKMSLLDIPKRDQVCHK